MEDRLKKLLPASTRLSACWECGTNWDVKRYKHYTGYGWHVFDFCHACNSKIPGFIPLTQVGNFRDLPELQEQEKKLKLCSVCGSPEDVHLHHWAPVNIFSDESEVWPKSYLCKLCHDRWHAAMVGYSVTKKTAQSKAATQQRNQTDAAPSGASDNK